MTNEEKKLHRICFANACMQEKPAPGTVFISSKGIFKGDNAALLLRELCERGYAEQYRFVVAGNLKDKAFHAFKDSLRQYGIRYTAFDSDEYIKALCTAGYLISDGDLPAYYIKRAEQVHLCLFDRKGLLFSEEVSPKMQEKLMTSLNRLIPQTSLMLCENSAAYDIMEMKLFVSSFFTGKLIRAAEPTHFITDDTDSKPSGSTARYTPEDIAKLMAKFAPAPEEEGPEEYVCEALTSDVPDRETSYTNIAGALFGGESEYFRFKPSKRRKIAVAAFLGSVNSGVMALRELCDRIDREQFCVTVYAFATAQTAFCQTFDPDTRIIARGEYTLAMSDMEIQLEASEDLSEKMLWKYEILRSYGSDDFDTLLMFNTVNPFRHAFAWHMKVNRRIFACPSEGELFGGYPEPEQLEKRINTVFDTVLLMKGSGSRLKSCAPMPIALSRRWEDLLMQDIRLLTYNDGEGDWIALIPTATAPAGCTLITEPEDGGELVMCWAADADDAQKVIQSFAEWSADKKAHLFLCVPEEGVTDSENVTVIPGKEIPLILMKLCDRFVYPYKGGSGMSIAAALMGTAADTSAPSADLSLLLNAVKADSLYCGYEPEAPAGALITGTEIFDVSEPDAGLYGQLDTQAADAVNKLFTPERQETDD